MIKFSAINIRVLLLHIAGWSLYLIGFIFYNVEEIKPAKALLVFPLYIIGYYCLRKVWLKFVIKRDFRLGCLQLSTAIPMLYGLSYCYLYVLLPLLGINILLPGAPFPWIGFFKDVAVTMYRFALYSLLEVFVIKIIRDGKLKKKMRAENKGLELMGLKVRLSAHTQVGFLNTLWNNIEKGRKVVEVSVLQLSRFYRSVLTHGEKEFIPLERELQEVRELGELMNTSYISRYPDWCTVIGDTADWQVPPFVVMGIVENAFKYADLTQPEALKLNIQIDREKLTVSCWNIIGARINTDKSTQMGLKTTQRILEISYGSNATLDLNESGTAFTVILIINRNSDE